MTTATLDINVLLSALIGPHGASRRVVEAWAVRHFTHVTSDHIITTFAAKLADPALARRFPLLPAAGRALLPLLRTDTTLVPVTAAAVLSVTGDLEDDAVLATVRLGQVDLLVTGDQVLLALGTHAGTRIVTPQAFLALLDPASPS